jgi:hypothetical protein
MVPSSPRLKADTLKSDFLSQQLNSYALASCAAGVSLLALAHPAEAEVVYTPAHVAIGYNNTFNLDLNHDGITDFTIREMISHTSSGVGNIISVASVPAGNGLEGMVLFNYASALPRGAAINSRLSFIGRAGGLLAGFRTLAGSGRSVGHWVNVANRFLGLKFVIGGQTHYGWARLNVHVDGFSVQAYLTGYAYETVPGKVIHTGQISGPADRPVLIPDSARSADSAPQASMAQSDKPLARDASLGMLALGEHALHLWRREERSS